MVKEIGFYERGVRDQLDPKGRARARQKDAYTGALLGMEEIKRRLDETKEALANAEQALHDKRNGI